MVKHISSLEHLLTCQSVFAYTTSQAPQKAEKKKKKQRLRVVMKLAQGHTALQEETLALTSSAELLP